MLVDKLNALLRLRGKNMRMFADDKRIGQGNLSQKGKRNSFYLKEAVEMAEYTDSRLAFIDNDGKVLVEFDLEDIKEHD